jgi:hypothetical protein
VNWNYRVVKKPEGYSVYEVFYDDEGRPWARTEDPTLDFFCPTPEDLVAELDIIRRAFDRPPLDDEEIGQGPIRTDGAAG